MTTQSLSTRDVHTLSNPFLFGHIDVRTAIDDKGEVWFCAKDIFEALDLVWKGVSGSLKNTPEKWQGVLQLQSPGGVQDTIFISEPAVYQTAFRSNKPEAIAFTSWVCEEVLPAIRKQGHFGIVTAGHQIQLTNLMLKLLDKLKSRDAFVYQAVVRRLRNICNTLGEPMPDLALIGQDRDQLSLGV